MKKVGIIFLGFGFGILCYIIFSLFFNKSGIISPIETQEANRVIQQNTK